jgi:hypothetical protein
MKTKHAFWDSSALVPLCCHQPASHPLRRLWRQMGRVVVWWGTPVEIRSAFSRLARDGDIEEKDYRAALARLAVLRTGWRELMPGSKVRDLAEALPDVYGLRAMDALQLAAGLIWCFEKPIGRLFICGDCKLREAAEKAGFTVIP